MTERAVVRLWLWKHPDTERIFSSTVMPGPRARQGLRQDGYKLYLIEARLPDEAFVPEHDAVLEVTATPEAPVAAVEKRQCPHDGGTCHHQCVPGGCYRAGQGMVLSAPYDGYPKLSENTRVLSRGTSGTNTIGTVAKCDDQGVHIKWEHSESLGTFTKQEFLARLTDGRIWLLPAPGAP